MALCSHAGLSYGNGLAIAVQVDRSFVTTKAILTEKFAYNTPHRYDTSMQSGVYASVSSMPLAHQPPADRQDPRALRFTARFTSFVLTAITSLIAVYAASRNIGGCASHHEWIGTSYACYITSLYTKHSQIHGFVRPKNKQFIPILRLTEKNTRCMLLSRL